jgi:hypothetical protein
MIFLQSRRAIFIGFCPTSLHFLSYKIVLYRNRHFRRAEATNGFPFSNRNENVRQGSSTEKTQISPSLIWSRAAISLANSSFRTFPEDIEMVASPVAPIPRHAVSLAPWFTRNVFSSLNRIPELLKNCAICQPLMIGK